METKWPTGWFIQVSPLFSFFHFYHIAINLKICRVLHLLRHVPMSGDRVGKALIGFLYPQEPALVSRCWCRRQTSFQLNFITPLYPNCILILNTTLLLSIEPSEIEYVAIASQMLDFIWGLFSDGGVEGEGVTIHSFSIRAKIKLDPINTHSIPKRISTLRKTTRFSLISTIF